MTQAGSGRGAGRRSSGFGSVSLGFRGVLRRRLARRGGQARRSCICPDPLLRGLSFDDDTHRAGMASRRFIDLAAGGLRPGSTPGADHTFSHPYAVLHGKAVAVAAWDCGPASPCADRSRDHRRRCRGIQVACAPSGRGVAGRQEAAPSGGPGRHDVLSAPARRGRGRPGRHVAGPITLPDSRWQA